MSEDTRQRFQGKCLQSYEGKEFMSYFDQFPASVRARASSSPYNICAACMMDIAKIPFSQLRKMPEAETALLRAIETM